MHQGAVALGSEGSSGGITKSQRKTAGELGRDERSCSSLFLPSLPLSLSVAASVERRKNKVKQRRKRGERGASDVTPHPVPVPGCSSRARCSQETLNHSEAAAEAAQLCFSTRRYTAVAEASPGVSAALRGIKQGAYS